MILTSRGIKIDGNIATPGHLNTYLKERNGYVGNLFKWNAVDKLGIKFREHTTSHDKIRQCLNDSNYDVILELKIGHYRVLNN